MIGIATDMVRIARRIADDAWEAGEARFDELVRFLDSPQGRRARAALAAALVAGAPLISRMRWARNTPAGRALQFLGGSAALVEIARLIRDWEPGRVTVRA